MAGCGSFETAAAQIIHSSGPLAAEFAGTYDYPGTVSADSSFVTAPVTLTFDNGQRYRMTIAGKFSALGFDAVVTLDRTTVASGATCRYKVRWTGTRVSSGT